MTIASTISLVDALRQYRLVEAAQLEEVQTFQDHFPEPKALAGELIRRGWLTPYQANQLLQGRAADLLLGSYVLVDTPAKVFWQEVDAKRPPKKP